MLATAALPKPQTVVFGARRTPWPQLAPTGSDASIASHTTSAAACSYCFGHPRSRSAACRSVLVLLRAPALPVLVGGDLGVRLRVERDARRRIRHRRLLT